MIREKIARLLRLAEDAAATPAEAGLALARAMDLSHKHNIDLATLNGADAPPPIVARSISVGARCSFNRKLAAGLAIQYFQVSGVFSLPLLVLIGTESDTMIAEHVITFITRQASRALSDYVGKRKLVASHKKTFLVSFYSGVADNLETERLSHRADPINDLALAIIDETATRRRAYKDRLFPPDRLESSKTDKFRWNHRASRYGYLNGKRTIIRTPVNGAVQPPLQLETAP